MACRRLVRATLFASLVLALWALARPASASPAPFCDDRGASAIAMPPALDAPDEAIARTRACPVSGDELSIFTTIARTRLAVERGVEGPPAALPARVVVVPSFAGASADPAPHVRLVDGGVTSRIERPPRG